MGATTKIQWCDHTFNPWIGCSHVHKGCANCYAEADMDRRFRRVKWGPHGTRSRTSDAYWRQPFKWNREAVAAGERRRVFCASLADVFEDWTGEIVSAAGGRIMHEHVGNAGEEPAWVTMDDLRRDLFSLIDATPSLDWLLLTKRPERISETLNTYRNNLWLGYSASDQETLDSGVGHLLACRGLAQVLFLSCEPLLSALNLELGESRWRCSACGCVGTHADEVGMGRCICGHELDPAEDSGIDWIIVGGESGSKARPCNIAWIRSIVQQCGEAGVACFVKQLGATPYSGNTWLDLKDRAGSDPEEWPDDLRVRDMPAAPAARRE